MISELRAALNQAYVVFGGYKDELRLAARSGVRHPLHRLTLDDWAEMDNRFDMAVLLYSDEAILLRHFLPRWLEWLVEADIPAYTPLSSWRLGNYLRRARWLRWPPEEVAAVRGVLREWTRDSLQQIDGEPPLDLLIEIKEELSPYLDLWLDVRPLEVARWLWTVDWHKDENVRRWMASLQVEEKLEEAFLAGPDDADAALLSRSVELVRWLREVER